LVRVCPNFRVSENGTVPLDVASLGNFRPLKGEIQAAGRFGFATHLVAGGQIVNLTVEASSDNQFYLTGIF
jgi:hypothetical protein